MAITDLADLIYPADVYMGAVILESLTSNRFAKSGVFQQDAELAASLSQKGMIFHPRYFNPLTEGEPDLGADTGSAGTADAITMADTAARKLWYNKAWGSASLNQFLNGEDPMTAITQQTGAYWANVDEDVLLSQVAGVIADNVANDSGDMVTDVAPALYADVTAATCFTTDVFITAKSQMGDLMDSAFACLVVHSKIYADLLRANLIDYVPTADQKGTIPTYLGIEVIIDDDCPATVFDTDGVEYTSYLFGKGCVAYASAPAPEGAVALDRDEAALNNTGSTTLYERFVKVIAVYGDEWSDGSVSADFPTYAEMANAANHDRAWARKRMKLAAIVTTDTTQIA